MQLSKATFADLIAGLYEAGFGRKDWTAAVQSIATAFGGAGSVIFDLNPGSGQVSNWIGPGLDSGADEYARYANATNPRMHFPLGRVGDTSRAMTEVMGSGKTMAAEGMGAGTG